MRNTNGIPGAASLSSAFRYTQGINGGEWRQGDREKTTARNCRPETLKRARRGRGPRRTAGSRAYGGCHNPLDGALATPYLRAAGRISIRPARLVTMTISRLGPAPRKAF